MEATRIILLIRFMLRESFKLFVSIKRMEQIDETQYDSDWQTKRCAATFSLCMIAPAVQYEITYEDSGVIISEQFERY
jgi:hypothetical protein